MELREGLGGYSFSTDKRKVEDVVGGGPVLRRPHRVLLGYRGTDICGRRNFLGHQHYVLVALVSKI